MTLDEMEQHHAELADVDDTSLPVVVRDQMFSRGLPPVTPNLIPIRRPGTAMWNSINLPEANKVQLLALKDGACPTCGGIAGAYIFDNVMLFYCHAVTHHRFKETLNWS